MVKIFVPNNNIAERKYVIDTVFGEFLGLVYQLIIDNGELKINDWVIELENGNKLIVEDHFFNKFPQDLEYLKEENIPKKVEFAKNDFCPEADIPIIYGNSNFQFETSNLTCGLDIFASIFFMLTRWEEYTNKIRDKHERFPAAASLAYKFNFLHRLVVNEYLEMLWNMLKFLGINQERKKREFKLVPTHDVDFPLRYYSAAKTAKEIGRDLLINKKYFDAFKKAKEYSFIKLGIKNDPYDTFDYMINLEKEAGLEAYFFFMGAGTSPIYDDGYSMNDPQIQNLVKKIIKNGHKIGIHPSYFTFNNKEQMRREKENIEKATGLKISCGRQHYLRFAIPNTWQIWEDNGMEWDSTLSYADKEGFRCGVCYEYSVFNILSRKKLKLKEKPLIVMEGSFTTYQPDIKPEEMLEKIKKLAATVKKYNGEFVFLWHNSCLLNSKDRKIYENIVRKYA